MATIDLAVLPGDGSTQSVFDVKKSYVLFKEVDLALAATAKGSALAVNDVIQAIDLPKYTTVLRGGITITGVMTGSSTDAAISVGITGVAATAYVSSFDLDAAALNAVSYNGAQTAYSTGAANGTIDILIAAQTGTITGGKVLVWAIVADISPIARPGLVQLKS